MLISLHKIVCFSCVLFIILLTGCTDQDGPQVSTDDSSEFSSLLPTRTPRLIPSPTIKTSLDSTEDKYLPDMDQDQKMQNLAVDKLGPYKSEQSTFGSLHYDPLFSGPVFSEFGDARTHGQNGATVWNPTFEFKAPADTILLAPISGFISYAKWQSFEGDWEIHIVSDMDSRIRVGIDHIVSIDCDRGTDVLIPCDMPLRVGGTILSEYTPVVAGETLGYFGNWFGDSGTDINGRTELMVFEYINDYEGVLNHCPTLYLDAEVEQHLTNRIQNLMSSFEIWSGDASIYDEQNMIAPGCLYEAIKEHDGRVELIYSLEDANQ